MKSLGIFVALLAALLALPLLLPGTAKQATTPPEGAPWQIEPLPGGLTRVFGIVPGQSRLSEARSRLTADVRIALIVSPGDDGSLEVYVENAVAGPVAGKMVLTLATTPEQREQMRKRARKSEFMESAARRFTLADEDLARAENAVIAGITFIPAASLDEQIVLERFGTPAGRIAAGEHREHFLYPGLGLDVQLDTKGKEVLQYVAPRDFSRLRDPLLAKE